MQSTHDTAPTDIYDYTAAGFVARSNSTKIENSHVHELYCVLADNEKGYAGGFIGTSECGGFADVAEGGNLGEDENHNPLKIDIKNLVSAVSYLVPDYKNCTVRYVDRGL